WSTALPPSIVKGLPYLGIACRQGCPSDLEIHAVHRGLRGQCLRTMNGLMIKNHNIARSAPRRPPLVAIEMFGNPLFRNVGNTWRFVRYCGHIAVRTYNNFNARSDLADFRERNPTIHRAINAGWPDK